MTQPDATSPVPKGEREPDAVADPTVAAASSDHAAAEPSDLTPEPEPWTPERVSEWNAYYDWYVMGAALLLAFVVSAVRANHPPLWADLKQGQYILKQGTPAPVDAFSYTQEGRSWVNVPWLFQASHAAIYKLAHDLVPAPDADPTVNRASAEQIAIGSLVALAALARLATALILIRIRRNGPGLWWSAVCAALALGAMLGPGGVMLGGIAQPGAVSSSTWGLLLLAAEMLLLFRAFGQGRSWALYALAPLFVVWANVDESFFLGLLVLIAAAVGRALDGRAAARLIEPPARPSSADDEGVGPRLPVSTGAALIAACVCAAACLANPSTYRIYLAAIEPLFRGFHATAATTTTDQLSYFSPVLRAELKDAWSLLIVYYAATVAAGLATFALNRGRFSWARFLPYVVAAVAWATYMRLSAEFAVVLAATASLNGQEWYQRRFGVRGRLGNGWAVWSTGGRLVTLALLFYFVSIAITGYRKTPGEARFGFGFDPDAFAFEAADYLAAHDDIVGNVFNWTHSQGDALMWRAGPGRKTFLDDRRNLFPASVAEEHRQLMNALRDDDPAVWKPALEKYDVSAVMIDPERASNTYRKLMESPHWIPFHDDGRVVMFGRADAAEPDVTAFKNNRLDPDLRAYRVATPVPAPDRPPTPVNWIDDVFQSRALTPPQARNEAARRWLSGPPTAEGRQQPLPDPARCILAIREARTALARNPDDTLAYRILAQTYRILAAQETALLAGIPLTPENRDRILSLPASSDRMGARLRQRLTALNYAIQTTPPPRTTPARVELLGLQIEMYEELLRIGFLDLAQERLQTALGLAKPGDLTDEGRLRYQQELDQLDQRIEQIKNALSELQIERQAGPVEKGRYALAQGAPGLAIIEFEDADRISMSPTIVKPQLVDLYCSTGQPERALELLSSGVAEDPNLGEPGASTFREGQVYLLLGNYSSAATLWQQRAVPRLRLDRAMKALGTGSRMLQGELIGVATDDLSIPGMISRQSAWEFDLAQCLLESGEPERAAEHFTNNLTLTPDAVVRPITAYYLEKLGRPVPPSAKAKEKEKEAGNAAPKNPADAPGDEKPKEAGADPKAAG